METRRSYTVHHRFQVVCSCCKYVDGLPTLRESIRTAVTHHKAHEALEEGVVLEVFDVMARRGNAQALKINRDGGVRITATRPL